MIKIQINKSTLNFKCNKINCIQYKTCCMLPTEVYSNNSDNSKVLFVGQGGGKEEERLHRPFVGPAGKRLREILAHIINNDTFFLPIFSNTVRCRPINNEGYDREPTPVEENNCIPYLLEDINSLKVKKIVALGKAAFICLCKEYSLFNSRLIYYTKNEFSMASIRGNIFDIGESRLLTVTYHPSFIIRTHGRDTFSFNNEYDSLVYNDIKQILC